MRLLHQIPAVLLAASHTSCVLAARGRPGATQATTSTTSASSTSSTASATASSSAGGSGSVITSSSSTTAGSYCITLKGSVDFDCSVSGGGFVGDCKSGAQICSPGISQAVGGGTIFLHAPGSTSGAVTLIESFFPNDGSQGGCDISMVDGYTFDAVCSGTLSFGYPGRPLWKGTTSPYGCSGGGAVFDEANSACKDPSGNTFSTINQAPPFFRPACSATSTAGAIVAAYQAGSYAKLSSTSADITCTISGGMPKSGSKARREASDAFPSGAEVVGTMDVETAHRHEGAVHAHTSRSHSRSLRQLLGGTKL